MNIQLESDITNVITCKSLQTKTITEHKLKKFIRRIKEAVKPTHARVRYDGYARKWAVLDAQNNPIRHFEYGVMTNVRFSSATGYNYNVCGQGPIGVAEGDLVENSYGNDASGFSHMGFHNGAFSNDQNNTPLKEAKVLRLMQDRRALYK